MANEKIDIAIVGGGVSGVYSAWKLKQKYPSKKIVVFEGSDRIGGRLLSVKPPGIDNMVAELGGMRILENTQPLMVKLLEDLNHQLRDGQKIETYDFPVDESQNIAYLRGIYLRLSDFIENPDKVPYHLSFLEQGGTAGSIITNAINQIVPGITSETDDEKRREMARNACFDGESLWKQGFWNVLMRVLTGEAYQLGVDAGGYNSTLTNWNAADAIPWYLSDFGIAPKYKGFKKGFQIVPETLARLFKDLGGEIRLKSKMDKFNYDKNEKLFQLTINNDPFHFQADALILAMPRRSIDLLAPNSPLLEEITSLTSSVTPQPLFKLFTTYQEPWWRGAGFTRTNADGNSEFVAVESGRSVTDLPVRQTYYWPTNEGKPAVSGASMLMASYDDGSNIGFWDSFRPRRHQAWQKGLEVPNLKNPFKGDYESRLKNLSDSELSWDRYNASPEMVQEVSRQLGVIHGMSYTPKVKNAAFRDWGDDPFGGGWNSWNIGVKSWEVKEKIVQPLPEMSFYICGEAYSDAQGWVEGALQTAEMVLKKMGVV